MDVYESMIETTIPNEIGKGIIGNYFIDKNNALWGYGANGRFWAEGDNPYVFRIKELTSDKLVFEYDYHKKKCKCIAIYTLKNSNLKNSLQILCNKIYLSTFIHSLIINT